MKLYTEDQVYDAISKAFRYKSNIEILNSLKPIELPTDEDVKNYLNMKGHPLSYDNGFQDGAWWMRDKIQGGK